MADLWAWLQDPFGFNRPGTRPFLWPPGEEPFTEPQCGHVVVTYVRSMRTNRTACQVCYHRMVNGPKGSRAF